MRTVDATPDPEAPTRTDPLLVAAARLAWMPIANLGGRTAHVYYDRLEARDVLVALVDGASLSEYPPELAAAIRKAAAAHYANRRRGPYYERRAAMLELRGALDVYDREALAFRRRVA